MKNVGIEQDLRYWAWRMVSRYDWLTIRFEYNKQRNRYLVSYYPGNLIDKSDEFCIESSDFEDSINNKYLEESPLFCDDEQLFKLSEKAETIGSLPLLERFVTPHCRLD